ncbi:MAG: serine hydrolase [SAR202 cluster bacterium]|nr:serine hydrolase [SAR202 cluster bacterium]
MPNAIEAAIANVNGQVGVAAKHLVTGKEFRYQADDIYFTASTLKVPVLVELYRQASEGKIDLAKRITLEDRLRVPGSGVMRELDNGLSLTVKDAAMLMIIVSDNTATDIVYNLVGRDNLNATMQRLGLTKTKTPMSTRELLFNMVGEKKVDDSTESFWRVHEKQIKWDVDKDCDALNEERSDVSSPSDMIRLLEMVYRNEIMPEEYSQGVIETLKRQKLKTVIPAYLPKGTVHAHKTGGVWSVRCDVGIVWGPNGPYTIALMVKRSTDGTDMDSRLGKVSKAIYDEFAK